ncbi:LysR family transcriptional regulator [Kribbella sp. NPDC006257]|uniref:LysR family transcriptional regulator n=1 Tax=Kribbella sp. NPDC006257 TaxID=3156738 RepID=UPI0033B7EEB5
MDPHLLRTFVTVADCGSFSAAATRLGYTQSAVSQHIATLENDLGTALLHRRPVVPTGPGERLLEHAGPILLRLDAARADVQRAIGDPPGSLILSASPLAASAHLADALGQLRRSHPGLEVTLEVTGREAVAKGVAAGEFDLGMIDGIAAPSDPLRLFGLGALATTAVSHEPLVVALPREHPLAGRKRIGLDELVDARWIDAPDTAATLSDLRLAAESDGLRASIGYSGADVLSLLSLVAAGHGLAVLPASIPRIVDSIVAVELQSPRLVHRVELLHGYTDQPTAEALAAVLRR